MKCRNGLPSQAIFVLLFATSCSAQDEGKIQSSARGKPNISSVGASQERSIPDAGGVPSGEWPAGCVDGDQDGWPACEGEVELETDCNDSDALFHPGEPRGCDGLDYNCNGQPDTEEAGGCAPADLDNGHPGASTSLVSSTGRPHAASWPEGCLDEDEDGWPSCLGVETTFDQDCNDGEPLVYPGPPRGCDGNDNNCNGQPDTEEPDGCRPGTSAGNQDR